jgi:hypothetical protein
MDIQYHQNRGNLPVCGFYDEQDHWHFFITIFGNAFIFRTFNVYDLFYPLGFYDWHILYLPCCGILQNTQKGNKNQRITLYSLPLRL